MAVGGDDVHVVIVADPLDVTALDVSPAYQLRNVKFKIYLQSIVATQLWLLNNMKH